MKLAIAAAAALLCSGCVSTLADTGSSPGPAMSGDIQQAIGDRFAGGAASLMLARYGAPARQTPFGDETIYTWVATETSYYGSQPPLNTSCQLDAYVTKDLIVRTVGLSGQNACTPKFAP